MTLAPLTESQLRAQITALRAKLPKERFIGIRAGAWTGPATVRVADGDVDVAWCVSALAMAERMAEAQPDGRPLVLVTNRPDEDLGTDVLVRLAKRRLLPVDPWRVVLDLFQARQIDPLVANQPWMAEALLENAPPGGYRAVASGVLDLETAWSALLSCYGFPSAVLDDDMLLRWAATDGPKALAVATEARREGILSWLAAHSGSVGAAIIGTVRAGRASDAVPIGLAARVAFGSGSEQRLVEAAVRLEPLCGGLALSDADGRRWAELAERFLIEATARGDFERWSDRAATILEELRARDHAWRSAVLRDGFEQRMELLGRAVLRALNEEATAIEVSAAAEAVRTHAMGAIDSGRVRVATMAERLVRWILHAKYRLAPASLADAVLGYRDDDAWADRARTSIRAGDRSPAMAEACRRLAERALAVREAGNRDFARLLASYTSSGNSDERIVPVEDIVAQVVVPLASKQPVLFLVLDGMSAAVAQDLLEDLSEEWIEIVPTGVRRRKVGLSVLPSITEVSRTSLFAGAIRRGAASDEASAFTNHNALRATTRTSNPPLLFHKPDLTEAGQALAEDVQRAIVSAENQVVGVVVNAIDDHLAKGDQIPVCWSRNTIRPLALLLDAARQAGRIVILTSDHGHLEDAGVQLRRQDGGGSRWRPAPTEAGVGDDEVLLEGPRVLAGGANRVVALSTEKVRYGTKHSGYHGGATPQEVVVPLMVFAPPSRDLPVDWSELAAPPPIWWEDELEDASSRGARQETPTPKLARPHVEPPPKKGQLDLLSVTSDEPAWIRQLLASPAYIAQRKRSERGTATDEQVSKVISALDKRGGTMTRTAMARALDLPPVRLATVLAAVRRLLNVEGYAVLAVEEGADTVILDRALLATQFDLSKVKS